jgi:uncharacterized membrane protein YccC
VTETLLLVLIGCIVANLVLTLATPILLDRRSRRQQRELTRQLIGQMEQSLSASVKLLEVRNCYEEVSRALHKMLQNAYRDGDRFRQDELRKLIDRLDAMRTRVLDKTVRLLEPAGGEAGRPRRRRGRRGRRFEGPPVQKPQDDAAAKKPQTGTPPPPPEGSKPT